MNVDFSLPKHHLAMPTLGSPGEGSHEQAWDGADSRDGCLCCPRVATARKGRWLLAAQWPLPSSGALAHPELIS